MFRTGARFLVAILLVLAVTPVSPEAAAKTTDRDLLQIAHSLTLRGKHFTQYARDFEDYQVTLDLSHEQALNAVLQDLQVEAGWSADRCGTAYELLTHYTRIPDDSRRAEARGVLDGFLKDYAQRLDRSITKVEAWRATVQDEPAVATWAARLKGDMLGTLELLKSVKL